MNGDHEDPNEYGSRLYDLSHELEQVNRESKARRFVFNVLVLAAVVALLVLYKIYPN